MKKNITILLAAIAIVFSSCEDWLTQEDSNALSTNQAYSTVDAISGVAANLYSRLRHEQDFGDRTAPGGSSSTWLAQGYDLNDLTRWDEATNNSGYWGWAGNVNRDYRRYYDYGLVRDINLHIKSLTEDIGADISEEQQRYFIAEARFMRAYVYFILVSRMGGVPIIEEAFEYTETPIDLARPRNKESEVYDYIASEVDAIANDLGLVSSNIKSRATKGAALALKSRAMLYAGTIGYNYDKNVAKNLNLPSGATGISKADATKYFQQCIDAYTALKGTGDYTLYKANADLAKNYADLFLSSNGNPEIIFTREYDGVNFKNSYTYNNVPAKLSTDSKAGAIVNPSFNQVRAYERLSTKAADPINPYNGDLQLESMLDGVSTHDYKVYDNPEDIFADRDPRLAGAILYPGSSFRGSSLDFQAGLAIKLPTGGYEFKTVGAIEDVAQEQGPNYYNGERITGSEGPHRVSVYVSHSGFLIRKFLDTTAGSEGLGASTVPYTIFRYGEVLLNAAEAAYCLSQSGVANYGGVDTRALALECINAIRERAGGAAFKLTDAELNFDRIMNERRVELAFEDHRYNDLKRWRLADQVWAYDRTNDTSILKGLWPYKIYAPGDPEHGKWVYRQVRIEHRVDTNNTPPINFDVTMYYATYEMTEGNPLVEKNPNH